MIMNFNLKLYVNNNLNVWFLMKTNEALKNNHNGMGSRPKKCESQMCHATPPSMMGATKYEVNS